MTTTDSTTEVKFNHALIRNAIDRAVRAIGTTNGTKRPAVPSNDSTRAEVAYKFAIARTVRRIADSLYTKATKDALDADVIFDHKKKPLSSNITKVLYQDSVVTVTVSTKTAHSLLNQQTLRHLLHERHELTVDEIDALLKDSSKLSAVPHEFDASIVEPA